MSLWYIPPQWYNLPISGPLAQLEEQLTLNQPVLGSSPRRLTDVATGNR